jgi:hypothetical protein
MAETLNWDIIWQIQRDICFIYHEQLSYKGVNGDLPYTDLYNLPYWEVFSGDLPRMPNEERNFVVCGCLFIIVCMCFDVIDGSGNYIMESLDDCEKKLSSFLPLNHIEIGLKEMTLHFIDAVKSRRDLVGEDYDILFRFKTETVYRYFENCFERSLRLKATA